jgi:hypothetical protein
MLFGEGTAAIASPRTSPLLPSEEGKIEATGRSDEDSADRSITFDILFLEF